MYKYIIFLLFIIQANSFFFNNNFLWKKFYIRTQEVVEPILKENPNRFVLFPIQFADIWEMYKTQEASIWTAEELDLSPDIIDWVQGRFTGQTIRMVVREGKIVEKVLLTPKGNRISVKRSKLELRLRSMPIIQMKFRIRLRPMPIIRLKNPLYY